MQIIKNGNNINIVLINNIIYPNGRKLGDNFPKSLQKFPDNQLGWIR